MEQNEKRKQKRVYVKVEVECRSNNTWQLVQTNDFSSGGMFIETDNTEPVDSQLDIMFEFGENKDEKEFIHAEGIVAWVRTKKVMNDDGSILPAGMGVHFIKFFPVSAKKTIEQYIKKTGESNNA